MVVGGGDGSGGDGSGGNGSGGSDGAGMVTVDLVTVQGRGSGNGSYSSSIVHNYSKIYCSKHLHVIVTLLYI